MTDWNHVAHCLAQRLNGREHELCVMPDGSVVVVQETGGFDLGPELEQWASEECT